MNNDVIDDYRNSKSPNGLQFDMRFLITGIGNVLLHIHK
jgi:hypothetical protein